MPNQAERSIVLLLFLISGCEMRDRKAILTNMKKRLLITAVEDAFCYEGGAAQAVEAWGEEGEILPEKLVEAARALSTHGTCRYALRQKRDKTNPAVNAARVDTSSRRWKSKDPETFATLLTPMERDSKTVSAIQRCIGRMYKGKSQRLRKGRVVGDFVMLLVAILVYRGQPEFQTAAGPAPTADPLVKLSAKFHKAVYDEHSGVRLVRYRGCGDVTASRFRVLEKGTGSRSLLLERFLRCNAAQRGGP